MIEYPANDFPYRVCTEPESLTHACNVYETSLCLMPHSLVSFSVVADSFLPPGCMWSICGIHDQGWAERPVFGKIRYMNYQGCKRKFNVDAFVARYGGKKHKYAPPKK